MIVQRLLSFRFVDGVRNGATMQSPIDPHSRWIYAILCVWFVLGLPAFLSLGFTIDVDAAPAIGASALIIACWGLRSLGYGRFSGGVEVLIVSFFYGLVLTFIIYPLLAISGPLADPWLARADRAIGFDWFAFIAFFKAHPALMGGMVWVYLSLFWQQVILLPWLWITKDERRAWTFVTALVVAMTITLCIYPFAPCDDAFVHYGVTQKDFPLGVTVPWTTSPVVRSIKAGARVLTGASFKGIVTFPSFHTAVAVMLMWTGWALKPIRYPVVALNVLMIVSCIVIGAHYFVDLIAGAIIGAVAIVVSKRLVSSGDWRSGSSAHRLRSLFPGRSPSSVR